MSRLKRVCHLLLPILLLSGCGTAVINSNQTTSVSPTANNTNNWLGCDSNSRAQAIGVNVNNLSFKALENPNLVAALQQSGAAWIRISLFWGWRERQPGVIDWSDIDTALTNLEQAHITPLITLAGPVPCWAIPGSSNCSIAKDAVPPSEQWAAFVSAAVNRYKSRVHYWEVWNEPDLVQSLPVSDDANRLIQYRDRVFIPGVQAIRTADPTAKIVGPALAAIPSGNSEPGTQLQQALALVLNVPASATVDIVSVHSYYPYHWSDKMQSIRAALSSLGLSSKPIWITEEGIDSAQLTNTADREQAVANFFSQEMPHSATGTYPDKIFWFAVTDSTDFSGNHIDDYGMINNQDYTNFVWTPRKTYTSMQTLVTNNCKA